MSRGVEKWKNGSRKGAKAQSGLCAPQAIQLMAASAILKGCALGFPLGAFAPLRDPFFCISYASTNQGKPDLNPAHEHLRKAKRCMHAVMRKIAALVIGLMALTASPLAAQVVVYQVVIEEIVEVPATGSERFVQPQPVAAAPVPRSIAAYGPFRVLGNGRAALVDATDSRTPGQFTAMLHAYPGINTIEMVECPGTNDDRANLRLGLMINARGIATHVPSGGSVRSGAVELFLAGAKHSAEPDAEFAVHSWSDEFGLEPQDYAADAPENRAYIDYYREIGMSDAEARSFYAMTNSVPNHDAKWMTAAEMAQWVKLDGPAVLAAKLDSGQAVN